MRFVLRPAARTDILRQYQYYLIEQNAEAAADRFLEAVQAAIEQVYEHPGMGSSKAFNNPALAGLRSWPIKGFPSVRIYYLHSEKLLRVVRVLHGKRDLGTLLEDESPS